MEHPANRIGILGQSGFLGNAISRRLNSKNIAHSGTSLSQGTDIREQEALRSWFSEHRPDVVYNCAAFVGGIQFGYENPIAIFDNNLQMTLNIYRCCSEFGVKRLINPISNCIYPSKASLFREEIVWDGPLDDSVLIYGMARKLHFVGSLAYGREKGLDTINLVLPNMFGPGDHFDPVRSHALGALIAKIVTAHRNKSDEVVIWGSGKPIREWLFIEDGASAMIAAQTASAFEELINVGTGSGASILESAEMISKIVGYEGRLVCDTSRPDGAPCKTLDGSRAVSRLNWSPSHSFEDGLRATIEWYISQNS